MFGKWVNFVIVGFVSLLVDINFFMLFVFMIFKLFGWEYDLFMKFWKFCLGLGFIVGNLCWVNNGIIRYIFFEYFKFGDFDFVYGIVGLVFVNFKIGLNGLVFFGYGFNIIGNDSDMYF